VIVGAGWLVGTSLEIVVLLVGFVEAPVAQYSRTSADVVPLLISTYETTVWYWLVCWL
jgi:hypothetical protein